MSHGKAAHILRREMMFSLLCRLDENFCCRCGALIESSAEMSIEHMVPWESAPLPIEAFLDLDNVGFSHRSCNYAAAHRPNKKYESEAIRKIERGKRYRAGESWKRSVIKRREKRRREVCLL